MINGMYLSCMGAMVEMAKHDTVANNLANTETAGFKPDFVNFMEIPAESVWQGMGRREADLILEKTGGGVWMDSTTSDFSQGPMRVTNNPLDMALEDKDPNRVSFFKVRTGEGEAIRYTRNGNFYIGSNGVLMTDSGLPVLSDANEPITIPANGQIEVAHSGDVRVTVNGGQPQLLGRIGVFSTSLDQARRGLTKHGDSLYEPKSGTEIQDGGGGVLSGMVEDSATNGISEMVSMIEGQRAYDLNMKFLKMQDSSLGSAIERLTGR